MRHYRSVLCLMVWILVAGVVSAAADARPVDLETILKGIETRYAGKGFSAAFFQGSMLKAMQISYTDVIRNSGDTLLNSAGWTQSN